MALVLAIIKAVIKTLATAAMVPTLASVLMGAMAAAEDGMAATDQVIKPGLLEECQGSSLLCSVSRS